METCSRPVAATTVAAAATVADAVAANRAMLDRHDRAAQEIHKQDTPQKADN